MHRETHPNPNEYFPLRGTLGAPGDAASAAALLAALMLAVAAAIMLQLSIVCTPFSILPTTARIEVRMENQDPQTPIVWELIRYVDGKEISETVLQEGELPADVTVLELSELSPGTRYELIFYLLSDLNREKPVSRYDFITAGDPVNPSPPPTEPATEPPTEPPTESPTEPPTEPETEPPTEPTDPPVIPTDPPVVPTDPAVIPPEPPTEPPTDPTEPAFTPPEALTPEVTGYTSPEGDSMGSYTLTFPFSINDGEFTSIEIGGASYAYQFFGPFDGGTTDISAAFGPGDITTSSATNTAQVTYSIPNAYQGFDLTATAHYTLPDGTEGTVTSGTLAVKPSFLMGSETGANYFTATAGETTVDVTLTVTDYSPGSLDFQLTTLDIWVSYGEQESVPLSSLITPPPIPAFSGGSLTYSFTIPITDPNGERPHVIWLDADLAGDCYMGGSPMGIESWSYAMGQVLLSDTYAMGTPELFLSEATIAALQSYGLQPAGISLQDPVTGESVSSLTNVVPGTSLTVYLNFGGTVTQDFQMFASVNLPGDIAIDYQPTMPFLQGSPSPSYVLCIIMPERDVAGGEILIGDLTITEAIP